MLDPELPLGRLTLLIPVFVLLHKADLTQEKGKKKKHTVLSLECIRQYFQKPSNSVQEKGAKTEE